SVPIAPTWASAILGDPIRSPGRPASRDDPRRSSNHPMNAVASSVGSAPPPTRPARKRAAPERPYINRELSWLDYAARVLFEARDPRNPLLGRGNFLTIFASMLDEFFQIRVSGLRQQLHAGSTKTSPDGRTAGEQLVAARKRVLELVPALSATWAEIRKSLSGEGVEIVRYSAIPEHHASL